MNWIMILVRGGRGLLNLIEALGGFLLFLFGLMCRLWWRLFLWAIRSLRDGIIHLARGIWRRLWRMCFGNFRRTVVSIAVIALVAIRCSPQQMGPVLAPLLAIGIMLFGIYVMVALPWRK